MINVSDRIRTFAAPEFRSVLNSQFNKTHIENIEMMYHAIGDRIDKKSRWRKLTGLDDGEDMLGKDVLFYIYLLYIKIYAEHGINKGKKL